MLYVVLRCRLFPFINYGKIKTAWKHPLVPRQFKVLSLAGWARGSVATPRQWVLFAEVGKCPDLSTSSITRPKKQLSRHASPLCPWGCVVPVWPWRSCLCRWFWAAGSCRRAPPPRCGRIAPLSGPSAPWFPDAHCYGTYAVEKTHPLSVWCT